MKNLLLILLFHLFTPFASADSWSPQTPVTVSSPKGECLLRSIPARRLDEQGNKWSKMILIAYRLDPASQDYRETSRFSVEGSPIEFFINDLGDRIVTMDQHFGIGQGPRVVVVYNREGRELRKWALKDFYDKKKLPKLPETTASVHWRGRTFWMGDQKSILISKATESSGKDNDFDDYLLDVRRLRITKYVPPKLRF
jgi:hypothetical protein